MLVEIALIQKLSIFLGHPVYALGIILFTIILSTGVGSYLSESISISRNRLVLYLPILSVVVILLGRFFVEVLLSEMITYPMFAKILTSIVVLFPTGIVLGCFFPIGMRLARRAPISRNAMVLGIKWDFWCSLFGPCRLHLNLCEHHFELLSVCSVLPWMLLLPPYNATVRQKTYSN